VEDSRATPVPRRRGHSRGQSVTAEQDPTNPLPLGRLRSLRAKALPEHDPRTLVHRHDLRLLRRALAAAEVNVKLAVGDWVVYAAHGSGRVTAREQRFVGGVTQEVVVIELADNLSVTLPVQRARERLRPVGSEADMQRLQQTLRKAGEINEDGWMQRLKRGQAKLTGGDLLGLAEIVRDGALRERTPGLPHSEQERQLYAKARHLLAQEIGSARSLDQDEADAWIEEQLAAAATQ